MKWMWDVNFQEANTKIDYFYTDSLSLSYSYIYYTYHITFDFNNRN